MAVHKTGEVSLYYQDSNAQGIPLVLLHGWCNDLTYWDAFACSHSGQFRVIRYDARGHGQSSAPLASRAYRMEGFVEDLSSLVNGLGLEKCILVGHSLGAATAAVFAACQPEKVKGVFICSIDLGFQPMTEDESRVLREMLASWRLIAARNGLADWARKQVDAGRIPPFILKSELERQEYVKRYASQPLQGFLGVAKMLPFFGEYLQKYASLVTAPAYVIIGTADSMFYAGAEALSEKLPNGALVRIKDGPHDLVRACGDRFQTALDCGLETLMNGTFSRSKSEY